MTTRHGKQRSHVKPVDSVSLRANSDAGFATEKDNPYDPTPTRKTDMDINEAALKLAKIEIIKSQIEHLQEEAKNGGATYARDCHEKAQELIAMLNANATTH